jgi:hypothetical protein
MAPALIVRSLSLQFFLKMGTFHAEFADYLA